MGGLRRRDGLYAHTTTHYPRLGPRHVEGGLDDPRHRPAALRRGRRPAFAPGEGEGNLLLIGGASALWQRFIGTGVTAFDNSNAYLGVGDSTTAATDTQTDLQAATNKLRKAMDATYPLHTDSTGTVGSKTITYRSTFATADANWVGTNGASSTHQLRGGWPIGK
jgi:hypothetical protein